MNLQQYRDSTHNFIAALFIFSGKHRKAIEIYQTSFLEDAR
jgi:hypothetical protein